MKGSSDFTGSGSLERAILERMVELSRRIVKKDESIKIIKQELRVLNPEKYSIVEET